MSEDEFGTPDDEVCWRCERLPNPRGTEERSPGWCYRCGFFFDLHGRRILEPWITCKVHSPINAICPHSGSLRYPGDL